MQLTGQTKTRDANATANVADDDYVGKHRPSRLGLLHPRVRVSKLAGRTRVQQAK